MESSIFRQIAELAREHKTAARATAVFLCLALVVSAVTMGVLTSTGHAMTQKVKVLTCPLTLHEHTPECRNAEGNLICGYADYVVHVHNDDCYGEDGALVCTLREVYPHTHQDSCYEELRTPICGQEEAQPHVHTEACYLREQGELICTQAEHTHGPECFLREEVLTCDKTEQEHVHNDSCYTVSRDLTCGQEESEEHTHTDACYTETRTLTCDLTTEPHVHGPECYTVNETLICTIPEHTHSDACYNWTETLTCTIPEGQIPEGEHVHTEECFEVTKELTCGKLEEHEHTEDCFEHDEAGNRIGNPICGQIELLEHVHGEDCFTIEEREVEDETQDSGPFFFETTGEDPEVPAKEYACGLEEHTHDETCLAPAPAAEESAAAEESSQFTCGRSEHIHGDACKDENGEIICGLEEHIHDASCLEAPEGGGAKVYRDGRVLITAVYPAEANLPEDVALRAYRLTPESDPASYENYLEGMKAADSEIDLSTVVLYNIGFYTSDGVEVEPEAPVTIRIQFLDGRKASSDSLTVVHFAEEGTEVLESVTDGSSISFDADSFSPFAIFLNNIFGFTADPSEDEPSTIAETGRDLAPFVTDVQLKHGSETVEPGGDIVLGENYTYHVKFQENGSQQFTSPMTFKLPEDFIVTPVHDMPVKSDGKDVGTYSIDENGVVTFQFNDDFLKADNGWVELDLSITAVDKDGDGHVSLPWNGKEETTFKVTHDPQYNLEKNTTMDNWDPTDCTVTYTVNFKVTEGVLYDPQITDAMETGVELATDADGSLAYTLKVFDETGKDITASLNPQPSLEKTPDGWVTKDLPNPMVKGQRVEIEYKAKINPEEVTFEKDENQLDFTVDNKATLTGKLPGEKENIKPRESEKQVHITDKLLTKQGSTVAGSNDVIDWTIAVGTGTRDVRGKTIKDTMQDGLFVDTSRELQIKWKQYPDDTQKRLRLKWEVKQDAEGNWQLDPNIEIAKYVKNVTFDENGRITYFELTTPAADDKFFTEGIEGKPDRQWQGGDWFEVEYYTKYLPDSSNEVKTYTNKVQGWEDFLPDGVTGTIEVGKGYISKYVNGGERVEGTGGEAGYIPYSVQIDVPSWEALHDAGADSDDEHSSKNGTHTKSGEKGYPRFYVTDELEFLADDAALNGDGRRFFVQNVPEIDSIVAKAADGTTYTFYDVTEHPEAQYTFYLVRGLKDAPYAVGTEDPQDGRLARDFTIFFNTHMRAPGKTINDLTDMYHYSQWTIDQPTTLIINYRIPDDAGLVIDAGGVKPDYKYESTNLTVKDLLEMGRKLRNTAKYKTGLDSIDKESTVDYNESSLKPAIVKQANLQEDGRTVDYSVTFRNVMKDSAGNEHIIWEFLKPESLVFSDTYDSRLEYVEGSLECTVYDVDNNVRGTFKIKEQGEIEFTTDTETGTTTMKAPVGLFDDLQPDYGYIHERKTLLEWLTKQQMLGTELTDSNYVFRYQLRIKDEALQPEEMTLNNVANLTFDDQDLKDDENVTVHPDVLDKTGSVVLNGTQYTNKVNYTIHVNPGAADLAYNTTPEGTYVHIGTYELEDVMDGGMSLDWSSVVVKGRAKGSDTLEQYNRVSDRNEVGPGKNNYTLEPLPEGKNGFMLYLPDEVEFEITYTAVVDANMSEDVSVINTVTLHGNTDVTEQKPDSFKVEITEATAGADGSVRLVKRDQNDREKILGGAEFDLYTEAGTSGDTVKVGDKTLYKTGGSIVSTNTYDDTSGQYGTVISAPAGAQPDDPYVLVETKAPEGYNKQERPIVFSFAKETDTSPKTVSVTVDGTTYDDVEVHYVGKENNKMFLDVYNVAGAYTLPESGGEGFGPLYAVGIAMIALSAVMLLETSQRKRKGGAA